MNDFENDIFVNYFLGDILCPYFKRHYIDTIIINGIKYKRVDNAEEFETDCMYKWVEKY